MAPKERWDSFQFLPRMPESVEQLDLLLLTVAKSRRVRRDGIRFSGFRYFDVSLNGYVGEDVTIRFDPRDLAQIHVYADNSLICRAVCFELSDKSVSLKEVQQARNHEAKVQRERLRDLLAVAEKLVPVPVQSLPDQTVHCIAPQTQYPKVKLKRFACDDD